MVIFFSSIQPSLLNSCRNVSKLTALPEAVLLSRKPMRNIFPGCCARVETQSANTTAQRVMTVICLRMSVEVSNVELLLDDLIRPHQHIRRDSQTDLFCRLEIYHQLELHSLFHGQISWLGTFQNLIYIRRRATV